MTDKLRETAQAIVDRWDSPAWGGSAENLRHTGEYIAELRAALAQQDAQAVAQGFDWSKFPGHLIDHYEGEVLTEELLQRAAADLCAAPTPPAQAATCKQDLQVDVLLDEMLEAAPAVAQVPHGWKLVPVAPTPEMRKAAADAWIDCGDRLILNKAAAALRAGIAAAPTPPAQRVMLTASEILNMTPESIPAEHDGALLEYARAVIEAYERKNGISRPAKASDQSL